MGSEVLKKKGKEGKPPRRGCGFINRVSPRLGLSCLGLSRLGLSDVPDALLVEECLWLGEAMSLGDRDV